MIIYADGSALGTPGPGGWAYCLVKDGKAIYKRAGSAANVTNNQMELQGAIEALTHLGPTEIGIMRCDSQYVVKGVNEWRRNWERSGWRKSGGGAVLNADLWRRLFTLVDAHPGIRFEWVKGHDTDPFNHLVDRLARTAAEGLRNAIASVPVEQEKHDPAILLAITRLKSDIGKLTELGQIDNSRGWEAVKGYFGDGAGRWVIRHNMSLGEAPIDALLRGEDEPVIKLVGMIEYGSYA